jgi:hypothetical protein
VNLPGTAVGAGFDPQFGTVQAAAWPIAGGIVRLNTDDPSASVAVAINQFGFAVGASSEPAGHATLWKVGPGRGPNTPTITGRSHSPIFTAATQSGPAGCLSDARALISKQLLFDCIVSREN